MVSIREYQDKDIPMLTKIWNTIVEEGNSFPQTDYLTLEQAVDFFAEQSFTGVAEADGAIAGLYILHPNNVGRCNHQANAGYMVLPAYRGKGIGELLVVHSLDKGKALGFQLLQFNAVVKSNIHAIHLYHKLGFVEIGTVPLGFRMKDYTYQDIILFYHIL